MSYVERFFNCLSGEAYPLEEWMDIARHLIRGLEEYLGEPIQVSDMQFNCTQGEPGFHGDITGLHPLGKMMQFSWFGFIHTAAYASTDGGPNQPFVAAWIFCRGMGKRLLTADGSAYIYLTYEKTNGGVSKWINHGWQDDEWGEFKHWE